MTPSENDPLFALGQRLRDSGWTVQMSGPRHAGADMTASKDDQELVIEASVSERDDVLLQQADRARARAAAVGATPVLLVPDDEGRRAQAKRLVYRLPAPVVMLLVSDDDLVIVGHLEL